MKAKALLFIFIISSYLIYAQSSKSVSVTNPGTLSNQISVSEQNTLVSLTVSGSIDSRDIAFIRDKIKNIATLNISAVSIKAYSGTDGTNSSIQTNYLVNEIPAYAFYNPQLLTYKPSLVSVTLPSNLTSIGALAFYFCWSLSAINIPSSVKSMADYAFYGCYSMSSFTVATSNTRYSAISGVLFNSSQDTLFLCPNGKTGTYVIPSTVKHIANSAFENCSNFSALTLPTTLLSIGNYAFAYCSGITGNLSLPSTLTSIGEGGFYGCYRLTGTVTIPASLTKMGYYSFLESNSIKSFVVNTSNPMYSSLNDVLYSKNKDTLFICPPGKIGNFTIPTTIKLIGSYAFYNCSNLTGTITIPELTDYIGYYAFYGCSQLSAFTVNTLNQYFEAENGMLYSKPKDRMIICPTNKTGTFSLASGLKSIDPGAFNNCTLLTGSIRFPAALTWIGEYAFYNCSGISGFEVEAGNNYYSAAEGVLFNKHQDSLYICPLSKSGTYSIPTTVKHIGISAFDGCANLSNIKIPSSVLEIGSYAFEYCTGLGSILIPNNVSIIGNGAFYACKNLQQFSIANPTPPIIDYYALDSINKSSCLLTVPLGTSTLYKSAPYWGEFSQMNETNFNTGTTQQGGSRYRCFKTFGGIKIDGLQPNDQIEIYSLHGLSLIRATANGSSKNIHFTAKGIFIVKINDFTEKLIL